MLQEFIKDDKNKLFFLKSVMLGIEYGEKKDSKKYKEIIQEEIYSISIKQDSKINYKTSKEIDKNELINEKLSKESSDNPFVITKNKIVDMIDKLKKDNPIKNQQKIILLQKNLKVIDMRINKIKI